MIKPIINRIVKPIQKPINAIRKNLLERRIRRVENLMQSKQALNLPTTGKDRIKERLENKLKNLPKGVRPEDSAPRE